MRKLRTFPHKESCNVFSSIKFEQQILNSWHFFQVVYAIWAIKHFKSFQLMLSCLHRNILCMAVMLVYRAWLYFSPFISKLPSRMVFFLKKNPQNNASFDNKWRKKITTLLSSLKNFGKTPCPFPKNWRSPPKKILSLLLYFRFFFLQTHARERRAPKPQAVCKCASSPRTSLAAKTVEERRLFSQV